jgi:hypothetical protein
MDFLTLKVRAPDGALAYATDFTLHELIPLVRHLTRRLERRPHLAGQLPGYRAVIVPGYDRPAAATLPAEPGPGDPPPSGRPAAALTADAPPAAGGGAVSFAAEVRAFFSPGTSPLCGSCPERLRCPGAGKEATGSLDGWIVLDPQAARTNRPIRHLGVRIEDAGGRRLHQEEVSLEPLQPFVSMVSKLLRQAGRLSPLTRGRYSVELIARYDGQPAIDPMLAPAERSRLAVSFLHLPGTLAGNQAPPETLVDWDSLEQEEEEEQQLEIQLLATESESLPRQAPPGTERCEAVGTPGQDDLPVYVHRGVLAGLRAASQEGSVEVEGLLVGGAFLIPEDGRPWIEIGGLLPVAASPAPAGDGPGPGAFSLLHDRGRLEAAGRGGRTVGWYRSHLVADLRVVRQEGRQLVLAVDGDRLTPTRDERFFHRHFFAEPWHVGLVLDGLEDGGLRFYRRQGEDLVACAGFLIVD